jgi:NADPH-dependent 2,4-dienoyl-CoA reductase/sulfur reductase-like enzyme
MSFCRIDDRPIRTYEPVSEPDALIIQDPTLLHQADLFAGLGRDGYLLINSTPRAWKTPVDAAPTGKRVLVVGAGPSGLSAACHLTRLGHAVTIRDASPPQHQADVEEAQRKAA